MRLASAHPPAISRSFSRNDTAGCNSFKISWRYSAGDRSDSHLPDRTASRSYSRQYEWLRHPVVTVSSSDNELHYASGVPLRRSSRRGHLRRPTLCSRRLRRRSHGQRDRWSRSTRRTSIKRAGDSLLTAHYVCDSLPLPLTVRRPPSGRPPARGSLRSPLTIRRSPSGRPPARRMLCQRRPLDDGAVVGGVLLDDLALLDVALVDHLLEQPPR